MPRVPTPEATGDLPAVLPTEPSRNTSARWMQVLMVTARAGGIPDRPDLQESPDEMGEMEGMLRCLAMASIDQTRKFKLLLHIRTPSPIP